MTLIIGTEYLFLRLLFYSIYFSFVSSLPIEQLLEHTNVLNATRRILRGNAALDTLPYMVYLRAATSKTDMKDPNWLCGGVIIHKQYILTSAACIEDVRQFYVVSGMHRWVPPEDTDECITNGAKRATWKCVPKNYVYDGEELNNMRWMLHDIAVVKVEDEFNFEKRVRGCDFIPKKIAYNNHSEALEDAGTVGSIAGWGSVDRFSDPSVGRTSPNSPDLLETEVILISKKNCKKRWPERYHYIIDGSMLCAKDGVDSDSISQICLEQEVRCKELVYSEEEEDDKTYVARRFVDPNKSKLEVHMADHVSNSRRTAAKTSGGFCENDHGGPLVVGHGSTAVVVGIISACLTTNITQKCYGPFLYTSVWKNRHLISCAIDKDKEATCRKYFGTRNNEITETTFDWSQHPEGARKTKQKSTTHDEPYVETQTTDEPSTSKPQNRVKKIYRG